MLTRRDLAPFRAGTWGHRDLRSPRCLLVHGFNAVPAEFDQVTQRLTRRGISCRALRLPGHEGGVHALAATTYSEWLAAVSDATEEALCLSSSVVLIGHSLGAALALAVAAREPRLAGVVALCPPLSMWPGVGSVVRAVHRVVPLVPAFPHDVSRARRGCMRGIGHAARWMPLRPLHSLFCALPALREDLRAVTCPALVVCARRDHVVPAQDGYETFALLGSRRKELLPLDRSSHQVLHDSEWEVVERRICRFCLLAQEETRPR